MVVRRLTLQDAEVGAPAIRLLKSSDGYPVPSLSHLSDFLSRRENLLIVASEGESPVGYAVAYPHTRPLLSIDRKSAPSVISLASIHFSTPVRTHAGIGTVLICPALPSRSAMTQRSSRD
jgi:hypothetical protein